MRYKSEEISPGIPSCTRRRFVQGLAAGGALALLGESVGRAQLRAEAYTPQTMTGNHFDLTLHEMPVNFTGKRRLATAVNGSVPGPTLRWKEGDTVTIAVTNRLRKPASIHWHGIRLPATMDGVPGLSFAGIAPGETFHYRFPVLQNGTYWYHSHSRFQEQTGLIGALVIDPNDPIGHPVDAIVPLAPRSSPTPEHDREHVILLSDWTDQNPESIFSNLKQQSDYYNYNRQTLADFLSSAKEQGLRATVSQRMPWAEMNMSPTDIADVTGATYTYLLNGNAPAANWTGLFEPGERVRLRIINGSSMTFFDVRIPGLEMQVIAADGNDVEPVSVDEFRIAPAEVYDVIVQPKENIAYTFFAQSEDRSGYARGTLASKMIMAGVIPPMDPRPTRSMMDMGMGNMRGMKMDGMSTREMQANSGADMPSMQGMDMGRRVMDDSSSVTPLPQPGPHVHPLVSPEVAAGMQVKPQPANPIPMYIGPQVDNIAMELTERLSDPGAGLSGNGRRVLSYADLRARYRGVDGRPPTREIVLHLSGNMERYIWGFNGEKFASAKPIEIKLGERVRIVLLNDTMMEHPIHLHGMWSELENGHGEFNPYKHTIIVKPAERVSYLVSADTPGQWAYHCHLLYHMEAGMFRTVVVS